MTQAQPLTTCEVAALIRRTPARVRQLDAILRPIRTARGVRLYDRAIVEAYAAEQAAKSDACDGERGRQ